jgi:hypothetical protein
MTPSTIIHRQVHPDFIQQKDVSSQIFEATSSAFIPTKKDQKMLSVYNGEKFDAKQAFDHFALHYVSKGVLSVLVSECITISLNVIEDNVSFDGHTYIDFSGCTSGNQIKVKAKLLKKAAMERGWSYYDQ